MAPRENLISSAVTFLQDPSVASSPVEKRIEFLKSKNLTQEEIDLSLARASPDSPQQQPVFPQNGQPYYPPSSQQQYRGPPSNRSPYSYNPYGEWQAPPPPEPPRRDWRDWFIMATVVGGASYGLYVLAQRYVKPLIAPPTPPQLEQDKMAIDEQFNKAFALIDTLASDTAVLKEAEEARTKRLDNAITDIETVVADLKSANVRREDDAKRMEAEIKNMKDSLPRSIDSVRDASEKQLKELASELGSLKLLMSNRMSGASSSSNFAGSMANIPRTQPGTLPTGTSSGPVTPGLEPAPGSSGNVTGVSGSGKVPSFAAPSAPSYGSMPSSSVAGSTSQPRSSSTIPFGAPTSKPTIPAWQMAASKAKDFQVASVASVPNGATTPGQDGADAMAALNAS